MPIFIKALWQYRHFIINSVLNDFKLRFARSKVGAAWGILNPLAQVAIYALILSSVLQAKIGELENPYSFALYLSAGMVCWSLFNDIVSRGLNVFIGNGNLIKKAAFPKVVLLANLVGTCLLESLLLLVAVFILFAVVGHAPALSTAVWIPLLTALTALLASGIALVLGVLNVFFRDIGQVTPIVLQIAFWFTPIVYPITIIPEVARSLLIYNPIFPLVSSYQSSLVFSRPPDATSLLATCIVAIVAIATGGWLYTRASGEIADVL